MKILAIETSCDETAVAVVENGTKILSNVVASSTAMYEKYGGIVPEVAAREQIKCIIPTIQEACPSFDSIDAIAVTIGPGLIGSLLVGVETAKTIAFVTGKPIIPVNHVLAHMYANFIHDKQGNENNKLTIQQYNNITIEFPAISLVASGGHTELYLMKNEKELMWLGGTLDDAAGECFDKTARLLGLGNGGGVAIEKAAKKCQMLNDKCKIKLPRPLLHDDTLNFSFSGLKTAILREVIKLKESQQYNNTTTRLPARQVQQLAYGTQEAITDVLVEKTLRAAKKYEVKSILLSGGVAANTRLRKKFSIWHSAFSIHVPEARLCTDNAVSIASYAYFRGVPTAWHSIIAIPDLSVEV